MRLITRLSLVLFLLATGLSVKLGLWGYLEAAGPLPTVPLARPLNDLPAELGPWQGVDRPIEDDRFLYGDEHLQRTYCDKNRQQSVTVWMSYSKRGADRTHHPEICMAVAGKTEDRQARQAVAVGTHAIPVQQYRFGRPGEREWVFYWYYTLKPPDDQRIDEVQRMYQRLRKRPSSLTVEVFAPERSPDDAEHARQFVGLLDEALQHHLPASAVRGSRRLPVTVIEE